jgi:glycosidase
LAKITSPDSPFSITTDELTGLPTSVTIEDSLGFMTRKVSVSLSADVGGTEHRHPTGGLLYQDTKELKNLVATGKIRRVHKGYCDEYQQEAQMGEIDLVLHYRLFPTAPYFELAAELSADAEVVIRNFHVEVTLDSPKEAFLNAPGNLIRRNLPVSEFGDNALGVSSLGGLRGSSGIIGVSDSESTSVIWLNQASEIPDIFLSKIDSGMKVNALLNFAAAISETSSAELMLVTLNLERGDFEKVREHWPAWASRYGLTSPNDAPAWMHGAGIYEVQIGTSYFWKNNPYCRYPEIRDLTVDLDRVQNMGFSVIQLMPRQPYPSYNVHDYADIKTSYGDEKELRELVAKCHKKGMRVILDVLLHGVLDKESIGSAVQGVIDGPLYSQLEVQIEDTLSGDIDDDTNYLIAWSRHILDFSEYWAGGSPTRTALQESNPDWFATDSAGNVSGVYTKAFDARNPSWQRYFRESMMHLITEYDVDGFRFDAPTYNLFANWAPWARARAFLSPLGCVPLFVDMRHDIKEQKPDALMYTEPSGHLLRRSMDVNYNYDEQWLVSALMAGNHIERGVRNGRDFMIWLEDRDDFLPIGSHTAHHIDSHDTFWWPQWGKKWRREQYGLDAVKALAAAFLGLDGPYMMFTGGEEGIQEELESLLTFRNQHKDFWAQRGHFDFESDKSGELVIITRAIADSELVWIVNTSSKASVALPTKYQANWDTQISQLWSQDKLAPFGFLVATRNRN